MKHVKRVEIIVEDLEKETIVEVFRILNAEFE
jgi:hypothetical protein